MSEKNNVIRLVVDGNNDESCFIEKIILGYNEYEELDIIKLRAIIKDVEYTNSKEFTEMELAIFDLQKQLPNNMQIVCCLTCKHGTFCPYGNAENEIFCLIHHSPKDKMDVAAIFSAWAQRKVELQKNELLYWCDMYSKISENDYSYTDWHYYLDNR